MENLIQNFLKIFHENRIRSRRLLKIPFNIVFWSYDDILSRFLDSQKLWLSQKTQKIAEGIDFFIDHHSKELKDLDEKIESQAQSEEDIQSQ
jgi:hypothetical protein